MKVFHPRSFAQHSFERELRNSVRMEKQIGKMAGEGQKHGILFLCITHLLNTFGTASKFFCVHGTPKNRILASNLGPLILHSFPFFSTPSFLTIGRQKRRDQQQSLPMFCSFTIECFEVDKYKLLDGGKHHLESFE